MVAASKTPPCVLAYVYVCKWRQLMFHHIVLISYVHLCRAIPLGITSSTIIKFPHTSCTPTKKVMTLTPTTNTNTATNTNTDPNTNNNTSRCHHSPERRLLHFARRRNKTGRCTVCDSPCSYKHDGLSGWWFRTLCGTRHRHGTSYERTVREVSSILRRNDATFDRV